MLASDSFNTQTDRAELRLPSHHLAVQQVPLGHRGFLQLHSEGKLLSARAQAHIELDDSE